MTLEGIDIHEEGNLITAHIRTKEGSMVTFCKKTDDCYLRWLWDTLRTDAHKGAMHNGGEWR